MTRAAANAKASADLQYCENERYESILETITAADSPRPH